MPAAALFAVSLGLQTVSWAGGIKVAVEALYLTPHATRSNANYYVARNAHWYFLWVACAAVFFQVQSAYAFAALGIVGLGLAAVGFATGPMVLALRESLYLRIPVTLYAATLSCLAPLMTGGSFMALSLVLPVLDNSTDMATAIVLGWSTPLGVVYWVFALLSTAPSFRSTRRVWRTVDDGTRQFSLCTAGVKLAWISFSLGVLAPSSTACGSRGKSEEAFLPLLVLPRRAWRHARVAGCALLHVRQAFACRAWSTRTTRRSRLAKPCRSNWPRAAGRRGAP